MILRPCPTGGHFLLSKSFDASIVISGNFVLTAKLECIPKFRDIYSYYSQIHWEVQPSPFMYWLYHWLILFTLSAPVQIPNIQTNYNGLLTTFIFVIRYVKCHIHNLILRCTTELKCRWLCATWGINYQATTCLIIVETHFLLLRWKLSRLMQIRSLDVGTGKSIWEISYVSS